MSYTNPTKGQILNTTQDAFLIKFYNRAHHTAVVRNFINEKGIKPTLDNAGELLEKFKSEWFEHYQNQSNMDKIEEIRSEFYSICVPLKVDVNKALYKFLEGKVTPTSFIEVRDQRWDEFKEFILKNKLELKHFHKVKYDKNRLQVN